MYYTKIRLRGNSKEFNCKWEVFKYFNWANCGMDLEKAIFGDKFHLLEQMETFLNKKFVGSGKSTS